MSLFYVYHIDLPYSEPSKTFPEHRVCLNAQLAQLLPLTISPSEQMLDSDGGGVLSGVALAVWSGPLYLHWIFLIPSHNFP